MELNLILINTGGDLEYGAFEIDLKKTPSLEIWALDEMYYEDPEDFEEEYKKRNV